ncbi:MAG: hypothetical protein ACUVX9_01875 [Anaerolineae bacterium]
MSTGQAAAGWAAATLQPQGYLHWIERQGLAAAIALLVGVSLLSGAAQAAEALGAGRPALRRAQREAQVAEWGERLRYAPLTPDAQRELVRHLQAWADLQSDVEGLPRPLGRQGSAVVAAVQHTVGTPYRWLALWLPYSLMVFALARALGGRASLPAMLAATTLCALPHLLDPLTMLPGFGSLLAPVLLYWGIAIYVRAVQVSHGLGLPQALIAALAPGLAVAVVALGTLAVALVAL